MALCHGGPTAAFTPGDDAKRAGGENLGPDVKFYLVRPDIWLHFVSPIIALSSPLNNNSHPQQKNGNRATDLKRPSMATRIRSGQGLEPMTIGLLRLLLATVYCATRTPSGSRVRWALLEPGGYRLERRVQKGDLTIDGCQSAWISS